MLCKFIIIVITTSDTRTSLLTWIMECVHRSETSVCASHTGSLLSLADLRCTAESLLDGLLYPVSHPAMLRFALRDPSLVVVANLLCCDTIDVEGFDLEGDRSSCQLMELKATPLNLVTLLGELHLLGQCRGCFLLCFLFCWFACFFVGRGYLMSWEGLSVYGFV